MKLEKFSILISLIVVAFLLFASSAKANSPVKIGIAQIIEHPALNSTRAGIKDELREAGYRQGKEIKFIYRNAQGSLDNAISIMQTFDSQEVEVVVALTTPIAQAATKTFKRTPIVAADITDFVVAGLVDSHRDYDRPQDNGNITGVSCPNPVSRQMKLIASLVPKLEKVGVVYNPKEASSMYLTKRARKVTEELGIKLVEATASSTDEVKMAARSIVGRVNALWISNDNTVVAVLPSVVEAAKTEGIPLITTDPTSIQQGPLLAYGWDYYRHGREAGEVLIEVLKGNRPNEIPIREPEPTEKNLQMIFNLNTAEDIGFQMPDRVKDRVDELVFGEKLWTPVEGR